MLSLPINHNHYAPFPESRFSIYGFDWFLVFDYFSGVGFSNSGSFFGHESEHHNSNEYYPMLAQALGRDAIYFDYVTSVNRALDDATYLNQFDALLLYANHPRLSSTQWKNLPFICKIR